MYTKLDQPSKTFAKCPRLQDYLFMILQRNGNVMYATIINTLLP